MLAYFEKQQQQQQQQGSMRKEEKNTGLFEQCAYSTDGLHYRTASMSSLAFIFFFLPPLKKNIYIQLHRNLQCALAATRRPLTEYPLFFSLFFFFSALRVTWSAI